LILSYVKESDELIMGSRKKFPKMLKRAVRPHLIPIAREHAAQRALRSLHGNADVAAALTLHDSDQLTSAHPEATAGKSVQCRTTMIGTQAPGKTARGLSIPGFLRAYPDSAACADFLFWLRGGFTMPCTRCLSPTRWTPDHKHPRYRPDCCATTFTATRGTIFYRHSVSLWHWFYTLALTFNLSASPSSSFLARHLEIDQATAWDMLRRIRGQISHLNAEASRRLKGQMVCVENLHFTNVLSAKGNRTRASNVLVVATEDQVFAYAIPRRKPYYFREVLDRLGVHPRLYTFDYDMKYFARGLRGYDVRLFTDVGDFDRPEMYDAFGNGRAFAFNLYGHLQKWPMKVRRTYLQHYIDDYAFRYNFVRDKALMFPLFLLSVARGMRNGEATPSR
jgi:hypothetical protein